MATSRTHLVIIERAEHRAYLAGWATAATALGLRGGERGAPIGGASGASWSGVSGAGRAG